MITLGFVVVAHVWGIRLASLASSRSPDAAQLETAPLVVQIIQELPIARSLSVPEVRLQPLAVLDWDLNVPQIEEQAAESVPNLGQAFAPPRPVQAIDPAPYARKAGLGLGRAATVILAVEVLADGTVGEVIVEISSGSTAIDTAAIDYARAARWIPATVQGQITTMRVRQRVTLVARG